MTSVRTYWGASHHAASRPWGFSGSTIKQVMVDVSGEAYLDLEKEAIGMLSRE